jgi:hypothetical protein
MYQMQQVNEIHIAVCTMNSILLIPLILTCFISNAEDHDDRSKPPLIRGRFKVIPGHVDFDKVLAEINS